MPPLALVQPTAPVTVVGRLPVASFQEAAMSSERQMPPLPTAAKSRRPFGSQA